jgi:hypothetical protein
MLHETMDYDRQLFEAVDQQEFADVQKYYMNSMHMNIIHEMNKITGYDDVTSIHDPRFKPRYGYNNQHVIDLPYWLADEIIDHGDEANTYVEANFEYQL